MNFGELMDQAKDAGGGFTVVPAGLYIAKCIESTYQASKTEKPQIKTRWEIVEGPHTGEKGLWSYFTLTVDNPKAIAMFLRHMRGLGFDEAFFDAMKGYSPEDVVKQIASRLEGRVAQLKIKIGEYNGEPKNEIDNFAAVPPGHGSVAAAPADPFAKAVQTPAPPAPAAAGTPEAPAPPTSPF